MNKILGAALVAALVLPSVAFAADKAGKVKTWVAATKVVTLEDGTSCTLSAAAPATLAVGKDVTLTYTTANNVNTCSAVAVK